MSDFDTNIPKVDVNVPKLGDLDNVPADVLQKADISAEALAEYEKIFQDDTTFWERAGHFFTATNKAGRWAKVIKDAALFFVPYGKQISSTTEFITHQLKPKQNTKMDWIKNRLKEKTTWRGIVGVVTALGVSLSPDQKEAIIGAGVVLIGLFEAFFKEPQSKDAK